MRGAKHREGAIGNASLFLVWISIPPARCSWGLSFSERGSFKLRLGTRSYWDSLYFFFTRDEIQLVCLKEVEGLGRGPKETPTIIVERRVHTFVTTQS